MIVSVRKTVATKRTIEVKKFLLGSFFLLGMVSQMLAQPLHWGETRYQGYFSTLEGLEGDSVRVQFSTMIYGSTASTQPFWTHTNQLGVIEQGSQAGALSSLVAKVPFLNLPKGMRGDAGFQVTGRVSVTSQPMIPIGYAGVEYAGFRLQGGRFIHTVGLQYIPLTIGSMMYGVNHTPVPQIAFYTPRYISVPFTHNYLQFKAFISHGQLEESRFTSSPMLHQKYFYIRFYLWRFEGNAGLVHQAQWGGRHPELGRMPSSINDYFRVLIPRGANPNSNTTIAELTNVIGNSIAAYDFKLNTNFNRFQVQLYRMFYLEDTVSRRFRSPWDGIWGFTWINTQPRTDRPFIKSFLFEHVNIKQQDSRRGVDPHGRARYYRHFIYEDGWTYNNRLMGLPLVTFNPQTVEFENQILVAHHLGIDGFLPSNLRYRMLATYSRNYGNVDDAYDLYRELKLSSLPELRTDQWSARVDLFWAPPRWTGVSLSLGVSVDQGDLYQRQIGMVLGSTWTFK